MIVVGQVRLLVTFARVDDECQVVDSQDVTYNLPRLDEAAFEDVKVMVGVHREGLEQALCPPALVVDDLEAVRAAVDATLGEMPEDEAPETMPVTMFCPRPVETNSHTDA